jgi:hypothetical protein
MNTLKNQLRPRRRLAGAALLAMVLMLAGLSTAAPAFADEGKGEGRWGHYGYYHGDSDHGYRGYYHGDHDGYRSYYRGDHDGYRYYGYPFFFPFYGGYYRGEHRD